MMAKRGLRIDHSDDAFVWERLPASFGGALFWDAVLTDSGTIVVGVDLQLNSAAFGTSLDGRVWQRIPHHETLFSVR